MRDSSCASELELGWEVARLFSLPKEGLPAGPSDPFESQYLDASDALDEGNRFAIGVARLRGLLARVQSHGAPPDIEVLAALIGSGSHGWVDGVTRFHLEVMRYLAESGATDLAAYEVGVGLGGIRALAWAHKDAEWHWFATAKLGKIIRQVEDLGNFLPENAGTAVAASMKVWQEWILAQGDVGGEARLALERQASVWLGVMSGGRDPMTALDSGDREAALRGDIDGSELAELVAQGITTLP